MLSKLLENSDKPFPKSKILRHIGSSKSCKSFYGPRFIEMKRKKGREKVSRYQMKNREKLLKDQREKYAKNLELKEKKKRISQKNVEKIKKESKELTSCESCNKPFPKSTRLKGFSP